MITLLRSSPSSAQGCFEHSTLGRFLIWPPDIFCRKQPGESDRWLLWPRRSPGMRRYDFPSRYLQNASFIVIAAIDIRVLPIGDGKTPFDMPGALGAPVEERFFGGSWP